MSIKFAIKNRRLLAFEYKGHARLVEPHTLGVDREHRIILVGYQIGGESASGRNRGWKSFHTDEIHQLMLTEQHFNKPRPEYKFNDGMFTQIIAQL